MTDFESDGIDESIEMPPTEIYDSDTDVVQPAGELKQCHAMAMVVEVEDTSSNGREQPEELKPEPEVAATTSVSNERNERKRTQEEDEDEEGISVPLVKVASRPAPVFKKVKSDVPNRLPLA
ncbi:hypothetical protein EW026_g7652 [Hermanssonia centrifuga]|uniref:Uncharacterized protein n=1 Tax=Hermanssonia centrifuga TaxID=98765 RepID=A0A4S4K741_9APHY|nr:hypothetical protein EW026_g7652 [Hermanssonia centrifuga]